MLWNKINKFKYKKEKSIIYNYQSYYNGSLEFRSQQLITQGKRIIELNQHK